MSHSEDSSETGAEASTAARDITSSRKKDHVDLCVAQDVTFRGKTTGLERYELEHCALPEIDFEQVDPTVEFLGRRCSMPVLISSMTGGYPDAERINRELAEVCEALLIPMGVGSQRQALESNEQHESFRVARRAAPSIAIFGNIGGAEIARTASVDAVKRLAELIDADGFAIHLNPLQELMQPEGNPQFRGVLAGIERLARSLALPIIVKEVGAGLSGRVVRSLLDAGVRAIDVAGAGGTSWSGVEMLRRSDGLDDDAFWDWGIPTADALIDARPLCDDAGATLIASGGIATPRDAAVAIGLGAHMVGAARPFLKTLVEHGPDALRGTLERWSRYLRGAMFLTGSRNVEELRHTRVVRART
jgi:isopentenyl-diphosphate Delta-isomerase